MTTFKFRLERVLNVRQIFEEQAKHEWALQERVAQAERLKLQHLHEQEHEIKTYGHLQPDVAIRQATYSYLEILGLRIERQQEKLAKQEEITSKAKQAWLEARKETKKITTLRENQYAAFIKEGERKEQKELDDMRSYILD